MTKIEKTTIKKLEYLGWNIGYMLRNYTPEARKIIFAKMKIGMKGD